MILMPAMSPAQEAAWLGLLDLYERHPEGWALIGGQLVHLHCAERDYAPPRPTEDADAVVNARAPQVLGAVTQALIDLDFDPSAPSTDGIQHRWTRGNAVIDVLIPEGAGPGVEARSSASGFPTIAAPGGTQALNRTEVVDLQIGDRVGRIPRPTLIAAMVMKAAARIDTAGAGRDRHCHDFATLAAMLAASDTAIEFSAKDKKRLRKMIDLTRNTPGALEQNPNASARLQRLSALIG